MPQQWLEHQADQGTWALGPRDQDTGQALVCRDQAKLDLARPDQDMGAREPVAPVTDPDLAMVLDLDTDQGNSSTKRKRGAPRVGAPRFRATGLLT